jgi:hypothetical protein
VKPDVHADVDIVVKLPDPGVNVPGVVGGVLGTAGAVVTPDCGCTAGGPTVILPLPVLGH